MTDQTSAQPVLLVEERGAVLIATLNRPERRNALSRQLLFALGKLGARLRQRRDLRAFVLTGAGDRAFCAGADLKERALMSEGEVREQLRLYPSCLGWVDKLEFPSVAALNGSAFGGGLELALACDLRVCAARAELGLPETRLGIIPAAGGIHSLTRLIGEARAKELILLGQPVSAKRALELGLLNRVVSKRSSVVDETLRFIEPISNGAPIAQRAALAAFRNLRAQSLEEGMKAEQALYEACLASADRKEALAAFAGKRKPVFRGR